MDSSDSWVINDVDKAPALVAAEAGYDVWLGNLRGNRHSHTHETLDPEKDAEKFFDFDIEHHTDLDLVAMVEYVSAASSPDYDKIAYVGHSMGTTIMYRLAAARPDFVEQHIATFVALGPVIAPGHVTAPVAKAAIKSQNLLWHLVKFDEMYELSEPDQIESYLFTVLCTRPWWKPCEQAQTWISTNDLGLMNEDRYEVFMGHYPAGGSTKVIFHYLQ